ncbi:MAG: TonB-dependent receptor [Cyclobacteriaceae bacterium]|nr:TonB-dependent receptor [Cyclobacteriaceae bacterium]
MKSFIFLFFMLPFFQNSYGQTGVKGRVSDEGKFPLPDANVLVENSNEGTSTDPDGYFFIELGNGAYTVQISSIGYKTRVIRFSIDGKVEDLQEIHLTSASYILDELVVSGSRAPEKITESPAAINLIDAKQFENFTGSPEELFALQKGVDFTRQGNFWGSFSIRGFNSAFNQKMLLLDDDRIANVRIRTPVGPLSAFVKEDVERVEIVLGPSSALYGPNCLNGLFYTVSKSPFVYPGTDIVLGAGSNQLRNLRLRHALKIKEKWAYKITYEYLSGVEENFTDSVYITNLTSEIIEGKAEVGLDRDVLFQKGLAAVYYKPTNKSEIGINYSFNQTNGINGAGRNNISGWLNSSLHATYKSPHWFAQVYKTWIKLDQGINTRVRTSIYHTLLGQGQSEQEALKNSGEDPRVTFEEDTYRYNGEIQYNNDLGNWSFVTGAQYQKEVAFSNNTYFLDEDGPIRLYQVGVYGHAAYTIKETGIKLIATARGDDHSLFGFNFLPKAGITYTKNHGTWRLTWGEGYSTPTLINTYMTFAAGTTLGNSDGFTLSDGSKIAPIRPETVKTLEAGYKSVLFNRRMFLDMDVYYNWVQSMISSPTNIATHRRVVTHRGDRPIEDFTQGLPGASHPGASILTNVNFGKANTYGVDVGINYYFSDRYSLTLNYSFFDYSLDRTDLANDLNSNGKVDDHDISINTPKNKISSAFNARLNKFYGSVFARWIQKYDFFSGRQVAAATNPQKVYNGSPVIEGARVGAGTLAQWNYGPLGGFYLSVNGNYQILRMLNVGMFVNNIIGSGNYEFVASAPAETTFGIEARVSLWKD